MTQEYRFYFEGRYRLPARLFGIDANSAIVRVTDLSLDARFGRWTLVTPLTNIAKVTVTGPYGFVKTAGPPHLSFGDRGLTFASNSRRGVCVQFHRAVPGIEPTGLLRHPNLTLTVQNCDGLAAALTESAEL